MVATLRAHATVASFIINPEKVGFLLAIIRLAINRLVFNAGSYCIKESQLFVSIIRCLTANDKNHLFSMI
jgi:hypothetical protein